MHHRAIVDRHVDCASHATVVADNHVLDVVQPLREGVDDGVHLAGVGVDFRVGGECAWQGPEEVVAGNGLEFVRHFDGATAGFDHRPRCTREPTDVGVGAAAVVIPVVPGNVRLTTARAQAAATNVTVAVPLGLAVEQTNAVHHAVTDEPVVRARVDLAHRVRPVAQVTPRQFSGDLADDRQVVGGDFVSHGGIVANEVWVLRGRHDNNVTESDPRCPDLLDGLRPRAG